MTTQIDPQPLEDGYLKRCSLDSWSIIKPNAGLIVLCIFLMSVIETSIAVFLKVELFLPSCFAVVLFSLSLCFLKENKRPGFDFFNKTSLAYSGNLMYASRLFCMFVAISILIPAITGIVSFFVTPDVEAAKATSETVRSTAATILIYAMLSFVYLLVFAATMIFVCSLISYTLSYFVIIQYNIGSEIFENSVKIEDVSILNRILGVAIFSIPVNRQAIMYTGIVVSILFFLIIILVPSNDNKLLEGIVHSVLIYPIIVGYTIFLYNAYREILVGRRKVKQEQTETDFGAVPDAV